MTVIRFDEVTCAFGDVVAVSDVTTSVADGLHGLLGPNGAGKSTLLRLVCGLVGPTSGSVSVFGVAPRGTPSLYRRIGLVSQEDRLFGHLEPLELVRTAGVLHGLRAPDAAARAALARVGMDPPPRRRVATFSKGMRQRVKLAQALVAGPELLVLDEPLGGLDPRQRVETIATFRQLGAEGRCVLVSSHVLSEIERLDARVLVMAQGRLVAEGDVAAIRALMDDRPHRLRVRTDRPRVLAAALLGRGAVDGVRVERDGVVLDTTDVTLLRRVLPAVARDLDARLSGLEPLDDSLEAVFRWLVEGRGS